MNRRKFFKKVGVASVALAALLSLALISPVWAGETFPQGQGKRHASFTVVSALGTGRIVLEGLIKFDPDNGQVRGGGNYVLFDATAPEPPTDSGKWRAKEFVSFTPCSVPDPITGCRFGRIESGILELEVELVPDNGDPEIQATMQVICNIGPAGIFTGEPEGVRLTAAELGGTFNPIVVGPLTVGLTHISIPDRE